MDNIQNKLTDAAKSALNQSVQEITELILEKAKQNACSHKTEDEISLHDVLKAKQEILSNKHSEITKEYRKRRMYLMISMVGMVYAVFGIMFYIYQNNTYDITKDIGLIIAALGIMMAIIGFIYVQVTNTKNREIIVRTNMAGNNSSEFEIVRKWRTIEQLSTTLMLKEGISNDRAKSINFIVEFLSRQLANTINIHDLKELLIARNNIVHKGKTFSKSELEEKLLVANKIIIELEKRIHS